MKERADVVVIGGGVVGVSAAHYLAERGRSVVLVEKGRIGAGSSYGNAGLVCPSHSVPLAAPGVFSKALKWMFDPEGPFHIRFRFSPSFWGWLWRFQTSCTEAKVRKAIPILRDLHRESVGLFKALSDRGGGFCQNGLMLVYRTEEGLEDGAAEARLLGEYDLKAEILDGAAARAKAPVLKEDVRGAVFWPEDGHLDPMAFLAGLARTVGESGAEIRTGTSVTGYETSAGRIRAVTTDQGRIETDQVVLAAGAWSPPVARDLGLRLRVEGAKGYSITMKRPDGWPEVPMLLAESKVAVTPMGETLRYAGTLEMVGLDLSINERRVEAIRKGAATCLNGGTGLEELEVWRGLRPCTPDGLPLLGRPRAWENLVIATGHAMIGLSLGPVSGRIAAALVCGDDPGHDLALLDPDR